MQNPLMGLMVRGLYGLLLNGVGDFNWWIVLMAASSLKIAGLFHVADSIF